MSEEEEEEEQSQLLREDGIPMEEDRNTSYLECFKKFWRRDLHWTAKEIKKLLLIFRIICSIALGAGLGMLRIPILFSMMIFVFVLSVQVPKFISYQLNFDIFTLFDSPAQVMRDNLFFIYILFSSVWISSSLSSHKILNKTQQQ